MNQNIKLVDFDYNHITEALNIAKNNYEQERIHVPELPEVEKIPDLECFAENKLGVAAFINDKMVGFLCAYSPRMDAFGTTNITGTFSPIHAHGVTYIEEKLEDYESGSSFDRDRIYSLLYQFAAEKWVKAGIRSHAIAVYAHDLEAINSFYYNGFGLRCIDAVRFLSEELTGKDTDSILKKEVMYCEIPKEEWRHLLEGHNSLIKHLGESPTFMKFNPIDEKELYRAASEKVRYFAAKAEGKYIAYIKIDASAETFVTELDRMMNICGAYCDPGYRGSGVYHNLLSYLITVLKEEGYIQLGVDCESINPNARGFWLKYFKEYTHGMVRRIDDKAFIY
jgi:GNAT superfamily N-acetyltransferase